MYINDRSKLVKKLTNLNETYFFVINKTNIRYSIFFYDY